MTYKTLLLACLSTSVIPFSLAQTPGADVRLTNDAPGSSGYISAYTLATGSPYTDAVLSECSIARGRQNEPAVEVNPRNTNVLIASSNDCRCVFHRSKWNSGGTGPYLVGLLPI